MFLVLWSPTSHIKITWMYQSFGHESDSFLRCIVLGNIKHSQLVALYKGFWGFNRYYNTVPHSETKMIINRLQFMLHNLEHVYSSHSCKDAPHGMIQLIRIPLNHPIDAICYQYFSEMNKWSVSRSLCFPLIQIKCGSHLLCATALVLRSSDHVMIQIVIMFLMVTRRGFFQWPQT